MRPHLLVVCIFAKSFQGFIIIMVKGILAILMYFSFITLLHVIHLLYDFLFHFSIQFVRIIGTHINLWILCNANNLVLVEIIKFLLKKNPTNNTLHNVLQKLAELQHF